MPDFEYLNQPSGLTVFERICNRIFKSLVEGNLELVIVDNDGNSHNCPEATHSVESLKKSYIKRILSLIQDGAETIISRAGYCGIVASPLVTESSDYGCLIYVLPGYSPDSTLTNINLIETLINQSIVIAQMVEHEHFRMPGWACDFQHYAKPCAN